jgi:hypothetical protein
MNELYRCASSLRTQGPITPGVDGVARRFNEDTFTFSKYKRHGVWAPAFAGTTDQYGA